MKVNRGELTIEALKSFCEQRKILVPSTASKSTYEAAITRAGLHLDEAKLHEGIGCFGYWASDDMNCSLCVYQGECQHVSLGMAAEKYERSFQRMGDVKIEFSDGLRKKRPLKKGSLNPKVLD